MRKTKWIGLCLLVLITFFSCKKVITVNLNNAPPQIVISGEVTNATGPYEVTINSTVNFTSPNTFPAVTGATVTISDLTGIEDTLTETSPGGYLTHTYWRGLQGNTYKLNVVTSGRTFTAISTMPYAVNLDSVSFRQFSRGNNKKEIDAVANFQDPGGIGNYYQFVEIVNDTPLNNLFIFQDRLSDGKYISQPLNDDSTNLQIGDHLKFSMFCIDANVYAYLRELRQLQNANHFNEATPANPDSNIMGGALGFFSAHTIQTVSQTVHL
jgi:hypothetical protein